VMEYEMLGWEATHLIVSETTRLADPPPTYDGGAGATQRAPAMTRWEGVRGRAGAS
jgi:hypothetical protein